MDGRNLRKNGPIRVLRDFECSRIEQAVLAAAYRRILPEDRLSLAEACSAPAEPILRDTEHQRRVNISQARQPAIATGGR